MANALYDKGREAFLSGSINWSSDTIKVAACTSAYTANMSTDQFFNTVTGVVGTSPTLGTKTVTAGVADAADATWTAVASGSTITQYVIYKDTGTSTTSPLIARIDTATNLPVATNGGDITLQFDNGSNKIFKL